MAIDVHALNRLDNSTDLSTFVGSSPVNLRNLGSRAKQGHWEDAYLTALSQGYSKKSAASLAGVSEEAPRKRVERGDVEFGEAEEIAYNLGMAALESVAHDLITHKHRPDGKVLIHLLACRGLNPKHIIESTGPNGGAQQVNVTTGNGGGPGDLDFNSLPFTIEEKRTIVELVDRAMARKAASDNDKRAVSAGVNVGGGLSDGVRAGDETGQVGQVIDCRPVRPRVRLPI